MPPRAPRGPSIRLWERWQSATLLRSVRLPNSVLHPTEPSPWRFQPELGSCRTCGKLTWAALPEGVSRRLVGPRLQAFCALLVGACHVTRRPLQQLLQTAFDLPISLGCLSALEAHTANALAPSYEEVHAAVRDAPCVNADETPWRSGRERRWLWLAATPRLACFRIDPRRSRAAFERLLEPRAGRTLTSDRYGVYRQRAFTANKSSIDHPTFGDLRRFSHLAELSFTVRRTEVLGKICG